MELRHKNWQELAMFTRDFNDEFLYKNGTVKDPYKWLSRPVTEAVRQFMIEVLDYGMGLSSIPAEKWFNEPGVRRQWADTIASLYEAYQKSLTEVETVSNPIAEELKSLVAKVDAHTKALTSVTEQMTKEEMAAMHKKEEEMEPEDNPEEEKKEDESGKPKEE
jgi:hypothetical protein